MRAHQAECPVATLCRVLQVSERGYYAWHKRAPSARARRDAELLALIAASHERSDATYGAPRVHEDLAEAGHRVGRKRVARLMRAAGLVGVSNIGVAPRPKRTTPETPQAPDLVQRDFTASAPNALWVADITYVPTYAGFLYLVIGLDAFSRRVVRWAMSSSLEAGVVLDAVQMAATQRRPTNVIHHADQGSQYGALAFGQRCKALGVRPAMGSRGDAYDNAMAESFFAMLECELLARRRFASHAEARLALFRWIEAWYDPHRRHSALGQRSPVAFERAYTAAQAALTPPPAAA